LYERVVDIGRSGYGYGVYQQGEDGTMIAAEPVAAYKSVNRGNSSNRRKSIEVVVTELMHEMGIPAHVKGYQYLRDAILRALSDESLANNITKELYPKVADKYNTTPDRVERGIRHAIELAWVRGNVDLMTDYFGYTINLQKGKPTNAEFIAMVSDRIRLNY
jgi:two-component system response regulator (stage 0 sporulation protein A)